MEYPTFKEHIVQSTSAKRMIDTVSPIYEDAYVGCWLFEDIGREWDRLWKIIDELPEQLFPQTATWMLELWERRYGIIALDTQTIEERREQVIDAMTKHSNGRNQIIKWLEEQSGGKVEIVDHVAPYTFAIKIENLGALAAIDLIKANNFIVTKKPSHMSYVLRMNNQKSLVLYAGCAFYGSENAEYRVSSEEVPTLTCYADEDGEMLLDENGFPLIVED